MVAKTIHAKLIKEQEDTNGFIYYIFENLESNSWDNRFLMVTRYPNWEWGFPKVNQEGFLVYTELFEGSEYYDYKCDKMSKIQQSHIRFEKFFNEPIKEDQTYKL